MFNQATGQRVFGDGDGRMLLNQRAFYVPWSRYDVTAAGYSGSDGYAFSFTLPADLRLVRWQARPFVAATNNGSNYWIIRIMAQNLTTEILNFNTSTHGVGAWTMVDLNTFLVNPVSRSGVSALFIRFTKQGSPGALFMQGPALLAVEI